MATRASQTRAGRPRPTAGRKRLVAGASAGPALSRAPARGREVESTLAARLPRRRAVTHEMIAALAHRLWEMHGGNAVLNWLEAERLLTQSLDSPTSVLARDASFCELSALRPEEKGPARNHMPLVKGESP